MHEIFFRESAIDVVGEGCNGHEAIEQTMELSPDVVLLDISMPGMNGFETADKSWVLATLCGYYCFQIMSTSSMSLKSGRSQWATKEESTTKDLFATRHAVAQGVELEYRGAIAM